MSTDTPGEPAPEQPSSPRPRTLERSRFGGSGRRPERHDDDAPVSRSDLSKGPQELLEHREARINWRVLWTASAVILAFSVWAILLPDQARVSMKAMVDWIAWNLGWYYVLTVTVIAYLVMASFHKVLRMERAEREGQVLRRPTAAPMGGAMPERSWKQRLEQLRAYPSLKQVTQFLDRTVRPALDEVAAEFRSQGYAVEQSTMSDAYGVEEPVLRVSMDDTFRDFHYQVAVVEAPVPMFSGRMTREVDVYYRLEVFTQTGSGGYDLVGLHRSQVIDDVLDRYEAHLAFLTLTSETDTASVLTPSILPKDEGPPLPLDAGDIQDLRE